MKVTQRMWQDEEYWATRERHLATGWTEVFPGCYSISLERLAESFQYERECEYERTHPRRLTAQFVPYGDGFEP